ncbi:MAG: DUF3800 domain-containing protein [Melioribacteraceae bacterium]
MYFCYVDESGTPDLGDSSTHFVLAGISIPVWMWGKCEADICKIKRKFNLENIEIHTAWILREYQEQKLIPDFDKLDYSQRRSKVEKIRKSVLYRLQRNPKSNYKQTKKNYVQTENYIHLTKSERQAFIKEIANLISSWGFARIFAECIDKMFWDVRKAKQTINEQAFEQLVSRFEKYLKLLDITKDKNTNYGLIVHDNNLTVERKHTDLMKIFHNSGTLWTTIDKIIETPFFVNSQLTNMVQIADLCGYSIRRYLEQGEEELFNKIFKRADTKRGIVVGVRHYSEPTCKCIICSAHTR